MADRIGLDRRHLQHADTPREHFDICLSWRARRRGRGCGNHDEGRGAEVPGEDGAMTKAAFRQVDLTRAIRVAKNAGMEVGA
ncbi:hypothetical protein [Cereibacter sediminicola]|uniref:hypothetical protein n=1 Tax=Cereibacter sediminicola TaxID=2584941 RepID=UPI001FEB7907|nr:hypothetical protein [Cereibacter sediminicola]